MFIFCICGKFNLVLMWYKMDILVGVLGSFEFEFFFC